MILSKLLKSIFGSRNQRLIKRYHKMVEQINHLEPSYQQLSMPELANKTQEFKARYQQGETLDQLLPEAFAVVRETSRRLLKMRHFDVQLIGGMVLHEGKIAEMSTGEGKTLVATLPVYLNALTGNPVHVVTVNEYLARRDAGWMGPIYETLGLTVGVVIPRLEPAVKKESYSANIIYATNNELGFDYLRNKMAFSPEDCVQGVLAYAIIDEVDSILIDEARTPLIISGPAEESSDLYQVMNQIVPQLTAQAQKEGPGDYQIDEKNRQTYLSETGHQHVEQLLVNAQLLKEGESLYDASNLILLHHLNAALRANALYKRDVDYLIVDQKVVIVDEHTGRTMPGRRWSDGLHQAVEAKENVPIQSENQTLASITFQNFFRQYGKLSGMTGTADTEAYEFQQIYNLEVVVIPTNKPCARTDYPDVIYLTQQDKYQAIIEDIKGCIARKRPVLVGTVSIENSELLSNFLKRAGFKHQVLNAKFHEQEAQIIAEAGRPQAVTIATNMAGRGTDIVLGGSFETELKAMTSPSEDDIARVKADWKKRHDAVVAAGGFHIIGTERHESRRIDNQLRGRAGRQGDPGSSRFYLSLEDNLMRIFASDRVASLMRRLGMEGGEAITSSLVTRAIENAQRKVEGHHFDIRKQLLDYDNVANDQRTAIYEQRDMLMYANDVSDNIAGIKEDVIAQVVADFVPPQSIEEMWDIEGLEKTLAQEFRLQLPLQQWLAQDPELNEQQLQAHILNAFNQAYAEKEAQVGATTLRRFEKSVMLSCLDSHWKEHLAAMDHLRQSVGLRGYAQKDPKQEYKREAFNLFTRMLETIKREVIGLLSSVDIQAPSDVEMVEAQRREATKVPLQFQHAAPDSMNQTQSSEPKMQGAGAATSPVREAAKVGRNAYCPCGSGKKYKHCHGQLA